MFRQLPGIYKITNTVNNKVYVGSSINVSTRITAHKHCLKANKHHNSYLQASYNKYKEVSFMFEVIVYCDEDELTFHEEFYINFYKSNNSSFGYNLESFDRGRKRHSEETKLKIGKAHKGKKSNHKRTIEQIEMFRAIALLPKTELHKDKIRQSKIGVKRESFSDSWKEAMSNAGSKYWDLYDLSGNIVLSNCKTSIIKEKLKVATNTIHASFLKDHVLVGKYVVVPTGMTPDYNKYRKSR